MPPYVMRVIDAGELESHTEQGWELVREIVDKAPTTVWSVVPNPNFVSPPEEVDRYWMPNSRWNAELQQDVPADRHNTPAFFKLSRQELTPRVRFLMRRDEASVEAALAKELQKVKDELWQVTQTHQQLKREVEKDETVKNLKLEHEADLNALRKELEETKAALWSLKAEKEAREARNKPREEARPLELD